MSVDDMQKLMDETPLTDLQGKVTNFDTIYPNYEMKPQSGSWGDRRLFDIGVKGGKDHPAQKGAAAPRPEHHQVGPRLRQGQW
jgi:hypothetical protein